MADRPGDRFTSRWIEAVRVEIRTEFTDPKTPGLILRVTPNGVKSWFEEAIVGIKLSIGRAWILLEHLDTSFCVR